MSSPKQTSMIVFGALGAFALGALFLVADPYLKFAFLLVGVFGAYLAWSRGRS